MTHYDDNNVADEFKQYLLQNFLHTLMLDYPILITAIIAIIIITTIILATMITIEQKPRPNPNSRKKQKSKRAETIAQRSFPPETRFSFVNFVGIREHGEESTANKMKSKSMTSGGINNKHGRANSTGPLSSYTVSLNYKNNEYTKLTHNNSNDSNATDNSGGSNNSGSISTTSNINITSKNTNNNSINCYSSYKNTNRINSSLSQNNNNSDIPKIYGSKSQYTSFGLSGGGFNFNMRRSIDVQLVTISKSVTGTCGSKDSGNRDREKRTKSLTRLQEDILSMNMKNIFQALETEGRCIDEETFNPKQTYFRVEKEGIAIKDWNGWLEEETINELRKNERPMPKPDSWSSDSNLKYRTKHNGMQSAPLTKLSLSSILNESEYNNNINSNTNNHDRNSNGSDGYCCQNWLIINVKKFKTSRRHSHGHCVVTTLAIVMMTWEDNSGDGNRRHERTGPPSSVASTKSPHLPTNICGYTHLPSMKPELSAIGSTGMDVSGSIRATPQTNDAPETELNIGGTLPTGKFWQNLHQKSAEPTEDKDSQDHVFVLNSQTPNHSKSGSMKTSIDDSTVLGANMQSGGVQASYK